MKCMGGAFVVVFCAMAEAWAGVGTPQDPYSIAEALALPAGATEYWAQGYIVGGRYDNFKSPWTGNLGISCADADSETNVNHCLQVKLENDGGRTNWGLATHPENFQKRIRFRGFRDAYGGYPSFEGIDNADISEAPTSNRPPVLAAISNQWVREGNALAFVVFADDAPDGDDVVLSATDLPPGATYPTVTNAGSASNTFLWIDAGPAGAYTSTFWAVDNDGSNCETIVITVDAGNPPVFDHIGNKSVIWSNTLAFGVSAIDMPDSDEMVLSATGLPPGASFPAVTNAGVVSNVFLWIDAGPPGVYTTTFWAVDADNSSSKAMAITVRDANASGCIAFQGFEGTVADTWGMTATSHVQALTGSADTPAYQRIRTDGASWQSSNTGQDTEPLELEEVDVSSYSDVVIELHLSATCTATNLFGMSRPDCIGFYVALDGAEFGAADLTVTGNYQYEDGVDGVLWGMDATGIVAATAGVARIFRPVDGGVIDDGPATVRLYIPDGTATVKFKIAATRNSSGREWNIDDVALTGVQDGGASNFPPTLAFSPSNTSPSVAVGHELTFVVTGKEIPNDAADTITLRATGLPEGSTFPQVAGTSGLSNTFRWTPTMTGTNVVHFFAEDKDGTNQVDATIRVYDGVSGGTHYGVFVGINNYSYLMPWDWLSGCVPDAMRVFTHAIERGGWVDDSTVSVLTNSKAIKIGIRLAISQYAAQAVAGDTFLYYHSSYGGNTNWPYGDSVFLYAADGYYADTELAEDLAKFAAGVKVVVMVDASHSGGLFKPTSKNGRVRKVGAGTWNLAARVAESMDEIRAAQKAQGAKGVEKLISSGEIGWITAADYDQYAQTGTNGSAFTAAIIAGWDSGACDNATYGNQDGAASFYELWNYAKDVAIGSPGEVDPETGISLGTTAQAFNTNVLQSIRAGWVGVPPPGIGLNPAGVSKVVTFGEPILFSVTASSMDGSEVMLVASNLPAGAAMPSTQGVGVVSTAFSWIPAEEQQGLYHVDFRATDIHGTSALSVTINVNDGSTNADLFISEYLEGSSRNRAIEIFNGTGRPVDLSAGGYTLRIYANGASSPSASMALSGSISNNEVYVAANPEAESSILAQADATFGALDFNGNDAVALAKDGVNIDVLGTIGDGTNSFGAAKTLVRKSSVYSGNPTYTPAEWEEYLRDTICYIGSHLGGIPVTFIRAITSTANGRLKLEMSTRNGMNYVLESCSNLMASPIVWTRVGSSVSGTGTNEFFEDATPPEGKCYYRIVKP